MADRFGGRKAPTGALRKRQEGLSHTGTFLLGGAGLTEGRRGTTHQWFLKELRESTGANVIDGVRVLRDGNLVTAGGVTSGIEMSLWLVEQIWGTEHLDYVKGYIAYDTPPRGVLDV